MSYSAFSKCPILQKFVSVFVYIFHIYTYIGENWVMNLHVWKIMKRQGRKAKCWWVAKYIGINECRNLSQLSHLWFRSRINPGISISPKSIFFQVWIGFTRSKPYIWRLPLHIWLTYIDHQDANQYSLSDYSAQS